MSENNYGALMLKSALVNSVDVKTITAPGIYPVAQGNSSVPDASGGLLTAALTPSSQKITFQKEGASIVYTLVNGAWVKPTAADVDALPLAGGAMTGVITVNGEGHGSYASQNGNKAPLYQLIDSASPSEYWPMIKQKYTQGNSTWSMGRLINTDSMVVHYISASDAAGKNFIFSKDGTFNPANYANFDARYQAKGNYTPAGQAYTKAESDARYVQNTRRGPQQFMTPGENGVWNGFELGSGYMTGTRNHTDDGNSKFSQFYFRVQQIYIQSKGWVDTGSA